MYSLNQIKILAIFLFIAFVFSTMSFAQDSSQVLSLDDCINIAMEKNSALRVSKLSDEAADNNVLGSYSAILPSVSISASKGKVEAGPSEAIGNIQVTDPTTGVTSIIQGLRTSPRYEILSNSVGVSANQNIFDGGIWWNTISKAKANKKSAEFDLLGQQNNVILQVQQAYFNLNKQIKLLEVYQIAVTRSQGQLDRTEKMYELGATAQLDVFQARVNLGTDRISLLQQKNIVDQAKKDLNLVMGRDPFTQIKIDMEINLDNSIPDIDQLLESGFENQPIIKKNEADIKSSKHSLNMARGTFFPRLYGRISYSRDNEEIDRIFKNYNKNFRLSYGIGLSFDLFNGFSDYASLQNAKLNHKSVQENFEAYKRNLASDIEQHYADYKSYLDIIEINKQNLDAAKEEMRLAEERYQIGAGTALEVREAQVNLTRAEEILIAAQFNARIVLAQLDNSLGTTYKKYAE